MTTVGWTLVLIAYEKASGFRDRDQMQARIARQAEEITRLHEIREKEKAERERDEAIQERGEALRRAGKAERAFDRLTFTNSDNVDRIRKLEEEITHLRKMRDEACQAWDQHDKRADRLEAERNHHLCTEHVKVEVTGEVESVEGEVVAWKGRTMYVEVDERSLRAVEDLRDWRCDESPPLRVRITRLPTTGGE